MSCKLYIVGLKQPGNDVPDCTPHLNDANWYDLGNHRYSDICITCRDASDVAKPLRCAAAVKLELSLLEDPVLTLPAQYFILDNNWHETVFSGQARQEAIYNSIAIQMMGIFEYESHLVSMEDKSIHRYLACVVERLVDTDLVCNEEAALASSEFKAMRQLLRTLRYGAVSIHTLGLRIRPRTFLERLVLKPIVELVDELFAVEPEECDQRKR